jgi:hypothetical protein
VLYIVENTAEMPAKCGRVGANIDNRIIDLAPRDAHQFCLPWMRLVMQTSQGSARAPGMVILHEIIDNARCYILRALIGLQEKAPSITENLQI